MTFVQMLERLRVECGVSGSPITDVTLVTGEHLRLKNWLVSAWVDIQTEHMGQWQFMRTSTSCTTTAGVQAPVVAEVVGGILANYKTDSFRIVTPTTDGRNKSTPMEWLPWDEFYSGIGLDTATQGAPLYCAVRPGDRALLVAPVPDGAYRIFFDYYRTPVELALNADQPAVQPQFHMLPVYRAMLRYARYEVAPEILIEASREYRELMLKLELAYLPPVMFGEPLA